MFTIVNNILIHPWRRMQSNVKTLLEKYEKIDK